MRTPDNSLDDHDLDEDGEHCEDECWKCLHQQAVESRCRCGQCCHLLIEVDVRDAEREPRIAERGSPIYTDARLTGSGQRELQGYLLNTGKDYACVFLDQASNQCTIYETRPLACRLFDCDGAGREQLLQLGWIHREEGEK